MYKKDLAINNLQLLIYHKTKQNKTSKMWTTSHVVLKITYILNPAN